MNINMKLKYISFCMLFILILAACSDPDTTAVTFPKNVETTFDYIGEYREIPLQAEGQWIAQSQADWCKVVNSNGIGNSALVLNVMGNTTNEERNAQISITTNGITSYLQINQEALPEGKTLTYRLPVIFHVLYFDENDKEQNPDAETIYNMLEKTNRIYKEAGRNSVDLNVEFYPAAYNPKGQKLAEPGIERVQWTSPTLDAQEVMRNRDREYVHLMWEPNDYTNILLYNFSDASFLGISTFPILPKTHPIYGISLVEDYDYSMDNLVSFRGVSINTHYLYDSNDIFSDYVPEEMRDIVNEQNSPHVTLAHELGHYLGLYHIFSEDFWCHSTDFCEDTDPYDYNKYTDEILGLYFGVKGGSINPSEVDWGTIFKRVDCANHPFESHNIMDYAYSYLDEFTIGQRDRVRHILEHSFLIPGAKKARDTKTKSATANIKPLPLDVSDGKPAHIIPKKDNGDRK